MQCHVCPFNIHYLRYCKVTGFADVIVRSVNHFLVITTSGSCLKIFNYPNSLFLAWKEMVFPNFFGFIACIHGVEKP